MTPEEKLRRPVSFSFQHWITEFLGDGDNVRVLNDTAALLSVIDASNEFIYVEYPNEINNYQSPVVWRIRAWNESNVRYLRHKEYSNLERMVYLSVQDCIQRLLKQLNHHLPPLNKELKHLNEDQAAEAVHKRKYGYIKFYNVNVDALIKADREFNEHKRKLKDKQTGQKI